VETLRRADRVRPEVKNYGRETLGRERRHSAELTGLRSEVREATGAQTLGWEGDTGSSAVGTQKKSEVAISCG